jgi:hypothetical protein
MEISLEDPEELAALDQETLAKKYVTVYTVPPSFPLPHVTSPFLMRRYSEVKKSSEPVHEDFSDMVAEHQVRVLLFLSRLRAFAFRPLVCDHCG